MSTGLRDLKTFSARTSVSARVNTITLSSSSTYVDGYNFDPTIENYNGACSTLSAHIKYYKNFITSFPTSSDYSAISLYLQFLINKVIGTQSTASTISYAEIKLTTDLIYKMVDTSSLYSAAFTYIQNYQQDSTCKLISKKPLRNKILFLK